MWRASRVALLATLLAPCAGAPSPPPRPTDPFDTDTWDFYHRSNTAVLAGPPNALRNLQISQSYHEIGVLFSELLGANTTANWPTMATWASNTVGMGIRGTMLPHWVDELLAGWPEWVREALKKDMDLLDRIFAKTLNMTSLALSGGNAAVFDEIGGSFTLFGQHFAELRAPDAAALARFLATFRPDQHLLTQAMELYYRALWEESNRTQLIYYANALTGLDEQTRLQPYIAAAFQSNYTVSILGHNVTLDFAPLLTRFVMTLMMPGEVLWMRDDLPARPWDGRDWAVGLEHLTFPGLAALYATDVPHPDSRDGTRATDWVSLDQRMRYVWPLFRGRQDSTRNNCPPFSKAVVAGLWAATPSAPEEAALCLPYEMSCCQDR
jgi:hypothetical protein